MNAEADAKFLKLRESGYRGPIDHNGDAVLDLDTWINAQLSRTANGTTEDQ